VDCLTKPYVVVCEGYSDARFICALLKHKELNDYEVGCPSRSGWKNISEYLKGIKTRDLIQRVLRGVLVITDSDDDPKKQFHMAAEALRSAEFPAPSKPFSIEGDPLRSAIFVMPGKGATGTLEHLLVEAALRNNPSLGDCLDKFLDCTRTRELGTPNQQAKIRMSSLVSAFCIENPWASAGVMWSEKGNPVPIESEVFNQVSDFLIRFRA
jgi:hypothetical protein